MLRVSTEDKLNTIFEKILEKCEESNYCRFILIQFMKKEKCWVSYVIGRVRFTFSFRVSSISESTYSTVKSFELQNTERMHGSMQQLMKHKKAMTNKNDILTR